MEMMVMVLGWTPSRSQMRAKKSPMGRVKWTSSHSSVSFDFMDASRRSLKRRFPILSDFIRRLFCDGCPSARGSCMGQSFHHFYERVVGRYLRLASLLS